MALGEKYYKDLSKLVENALNIRSGQIFNDLYHDILTISPKYILQRDLVSIINWSLCSITIEDILEGTFPFSIGVLNTVFKAYYPNSNKKVRDEKIKKMYSFIKSAPKEEFDIHSIWDWKIDIGSLKIIDGLAKKIQEPSLDRLKIYSKIAIALKWLQYPSVKNKFSLGLQKHILWLGDTFGKYDEEELGKLNSFLKDPYPIQERDFEVLEKSDLLDLGLIYCKEQIGEGIDKLKLYEENFDRFVPQENYEKEKEKIMKEKEITLNQRTEEIMKEQELSEDQKKEKIMKEKELTTNRTKKRLLRIKEVREKLKTFNQLYLLSNSIKTLKESAEGKEVLELEHFKCELLPAIFLTYVQDAYLLKEIDPIEAIANYRKDMDERFKRFVFEPISLIRASWNIRDIYIKTKKKSGTDAKT